MCGCTFLFILSLCSTCNMGGLILVVYQRFGKRFGNKNLSIELGRIGLVTNERPQSVGIFQTESETLDQADL